MTPVETEKWVKEKMLPIFPLGVKKDVPREEPWPLPPTPSFTPGKMLDVDRRRRARRPSASATASRARPGGRTSAIKLAGAGGDGAQTAALLLARAAINEGFDSTHIPSYGPESRGGTSYADVRIAEDEVLSPAAPEPARPRGVQRPERREVRPARAGGRRRRLRQLGGRRACPPLRPGVRAVGVPFTQIAADLGKVIVKNIVALGRAPGGDAALPEGDLPDRDPAGARRQVRAHPAQRGGVRLGRQEGGRGREGGVVSGQGLLRPQPRGDEAPPRAARDPAEPPAGPA